MKTPIKKQTISGAPLTEVSPAIKSKKFVFGRENRLFEMHKKEMITRMFLQECICSHITYCMLDYGGSHKQYTKKTK